MEQFVGGDYSSNELAVRIRMVKRDAETSYFAAQLLDELWRLYVEMESIIPEEEKSEASYGA